ncbi:MAG TPA: hypothetical protein VED40_06660 [Azospirillaceae bacterium]|nr:hypothetical protein [Azospirillaceae bacterium]
MQNTQSQCALVAFDSDRPFDADIIDRLERTLQISDRYSLAAGLKIRTATLVNSPRGLVVVASVTNIPGNHSPDFIAVQLEGGLRYVCKEQGVVEPYVRNIAVVAIEPQMKVVAECANGLRNLVDQVGDAPERFGKILRIFLPARPDGGPPTPEDFRAAGTRLRNRLRERLSDLAREGDKDKPQVAYTEAGPPAEAKPAAPPPEGTDIRVIDAIEGLAASDPPTTVATLLYEVRMLHAELQDLSDRTLAIQRQLLPKVEALVRADAGRGPPHLLDRLERYADKVLRPLTALGKLLK